MLDNLRLLKIAFVLFVLLISCGEGNKQNTDVQNTDGRAEQSIMSDEHKHLFEQIREKDSLLFQLGFNQIDTSQLAKLASEDIEFYHDENGITESKKDFVKSINRLRDLPFKTWRVLVEGSMEVFPLYRNNKQELYGAIQNGTHDFYQQIDGQEARKTNTARFSHLWILENEEWKLKRVFSYDHHVPE